MSLLDSSQQRIKRKLDDYAPSPDDDDDGDPHDFSSVRMRTDEPGAAAANSSSSDQIHRHHHSQLHSRVSDSRSSSCYSNSAPSHSRLQFFVRMFSGLKTLVLRADSSDTIKSIHDRIHLITGIPITEQRLIHRGKQLHWEQTLADCSIEKDASLQLVGVMRSTGHPKAWQAIDSIVSIICHMCKTQSATSSDTVMIKHSLEDFIEKIPQNDIDKASSYLQILTSSRAPTALAMLYMSANPQIKKCGDDLIKHLVTSFNVLPHFLHQHCGPILVEICKVLRMASPDDALYINCRTCLGSMLRHIKLHTMSKTGESSNLDVTLIDIVTFVTELAGKLTFELDSSARSNTREGPSLADVHDFTNFLRPLRNLIKEEVGVRSGNSPLKNGNCDFPSYGEVTKYLYEMFSLLLAKMDICLSKVEDLLSTKSEVPHMGCYQYLTILNELDSVSKLYKGAEQQLWTMLGNRKLSFCYLIVTYAKRGDDHEWIFDHKDVTNFECRRHLAMMLLPEQRDEYEELHEMLIDRSQLLPESFEYIAHADTDTLRAGLFMEFKNEEATGPGVLREWFLLVCQAIFNPQNALFVACPNDRRRFFPNPASKVDPLHLEYFRFSGRVIALALMHKVQTGIVFDRVLFLQLAGKNVSLEDIQDADPLLYNSWKKILEMDPEIVDQDVLALTFILEIDELGSRKVVELCPDGKNIAVNSQNRRKYVDLLIEHCFVKSISDQVAHFIQGFNDIINSTRLRKSFFRSLELEDLDGMLHGSDRAISVDDWKAHTEYYGYKETDPQILWFWKTVGEMSAEERKMLLFFWTSVKYVPVEGFRGLASRLYIYRSNETGDRLPSSHTCFYQLCLPPYPSLKVMRDRLRIITQEHVGCSFGTC